MSLEGCVATFKKRQEAVLCQCHKHSQCLTCAVRLTPAGLRLEQWIGTQRLVSQTLQTEDELYEQAEVVRQQCLDEGWVEES